MTTHTETGGLPFTLAVWSCEECHRDGEWWVRSENPSKKAAELLHQIATPGCMGRLTITNVVEGREKP